MGFMDGIGRFMQGKPVFEDTSTKDRGSDHIPTQDPANPQAEAGPLLVDDRGYKVVPHIALSNVKARRDGNTMIVTVYATNSSEHHVRVDEIYVMGQKQVFNRELTPNQAHELIVYKGPVANDDNNNKAELVFRIMENGDLFKNAYYMEFNQQSDGKFVIEDFKDNGPTRDI